jgi:hypothetical protein
MSLKAHRPTYVCVKADESDDGATAPKHVIQTQNIMFVYFKSVMF